MIAGTAICTVGAGLLTTLQTDTGMAKWVGYQVLYGVRYPTFPDPYLAPKLQRFAIGHGAVLQVDERDYEYADSLLVGLVRPGSLFSGSEPSGANCSPQE